jgi:hypothetical protein
MSVAKERARLAERRYRRLESSALWQHWGSLVAMAAMLQRAYKTADDYADGWLSANESAFVCQRRLESQLTWQSWQALVAMATVKKRTHHTSHAKGYSAGRRRQARSDESLRVWQAWTGVLVMAAYVESARDIAHDAGMDSQRDLSVPD